MAVRYLFRAETVKTVSAFSFIVLTKIGKRSYINMKYKDWLDEWLNHYVKTSNKQRTYERYCRTAKVHIIPHLGEYELDELQPIILQRFISELLTIGNKRTGKGLSPNFVKSVISVLQNSLKTAHTLGLISEYTADKINRPKIVEKQVECFSVTKTCHDGNVNGISFVVNQSCPTKFQCSL